MIYLFIHQNFPGQYRHLIRHLSQDPANRVYFISQPNANWMPGVTRLVYYPDLKTPLRCHPYSVDFELAVRHGAAVADTLRMMKGQGVTPDVIIGHSGWGETLCVKDVFPDVPLLAYFEFFYHAAGVDTDFDPEFPPTERDGGRVRMRNSVNLLSHACADWGHTPTLWQHGLYPPEMRPRISVIHEGIDTDLVRPDTAASFRVPGKALTLTGEDEVITYVARNLEPYRGFHVAMRAVAEIQRRRPKARFVIAGGDGVSYGSPPPDGTTWQTRMLAELDGQIDLGRVHFTGPLPYADYLNLLRVSSAHIYLTYPFVLSWSLLEAMAAGCAVIGSATPPVEEVIRHGENGLLVDFFSPAAIADATDILLDDTERARFMRDTARRTVVERYDLRTRALPQWDRLLGDLIARRRPDAREAGTPSLRLVG